MIANNQLNSIFPPGEWARLLYHLAPLVFASKPAIALNQACMSGGADWGQRITGCLTRLAPDCISHAFQFSVNQDRSLIFFYVPAILEGILGRPLIRKFLTKYGYRPDGNLDADLEHLQTRLQGPFPHEIGVFLGIPDDDVAGFIINAGKNYLFNGYWKVYQNPDQARRIFGEFNRAKWLMGDVIRQYRDCTYE